MIFSPRRPTVTALVGHVPVGSAHPVVVQSMTNTDTADPASTAEQVIHLATAGSQIVRVTVNNDAAAAAVPGAQPMISADGGIGDDRAHELGLADGRTSGAWRVHRS